MTAEHPAVQALAHSVPLGAATLEDLDAYGGHRTGVNTAAEKGRAAFMDRTVTRATRTQGVANAYIPL